MQEKQSIKLMRETVAIRLEKYRITQEKFSNKFLIIVHITPM